MIGTWINSAGDLVKLVTGNPRATWQFVVLLVAALAACAVALKIGVQAMRMPITDFGHSIQATVGGAVLVLFAAVAADLYLAPHLPAGTLRALAPLAGAVAGLLALAVPLVCMFHRGNYLQSLVTALLGAAAAAAVAFLLQAWFGAAATGEKETKGIRKHKQDVEKFMRSEPPPGWRDPCRPPPRAAVIV
jgi:hypothetical protein